MDGRKTKNVLNEPGNSQVWSQNLLESDTLQIPKEERPYFLGEGMLALVYCSIGSWFDEGESGAPWFCQGLKPTFPSIAHLDIKLPRGPAKCQAKGILHTVHLPLTGHVSAPILQIRTNEAQSKAGKCLISLEALVLSSYLASSACVTSLSDVSAD